MTRAEAITNINIMIENLKAQLTPGLGYGMRKLFNQQIASLRFAVEEMLRLEGLEK